MFMDFVPLWVKTDYSILKSLIKIDDLINILSSNNIKCASICDDNLYGVMEFYTKCIKNNIKPIIGLEINIGYTILLYAKDYKGYQNLCNINTLLSKGELNINSLKEYLSNLVVVIPFVNKDKKDELEIYAKDIFIGYANDDEKNNIEGNKVYINKTLSLTKDKTKYLKYLYKINEKEYEGENDVSLKLDVNIEDIKTTSYLANMCNLKIEKQNDLLPIYNSDPSFDAKKYLTDLCIYGLKKRLNNNVTKDYVDRLKYELDIIIKMDFVNYFLVVWDYVKYAKKNNIMVGPGRGSAASSLISYSLGITDIDPLKYNLLFERFLNPNRVTMPDIDIDFDAEKRDEVIKYVTNKYGTEKVSGIITFSNLLAKQVIRDVSRVLNVSNYKVDNLVKAFDDKKDLKTMVNNMNVKRILNNDSELKKVYDIALNLEGLKRHTSIHAAGIIISNKNLSNYVPLAADPSGSYLCGYTMNYIEDLGLLKMDFLGIKNLTVVDKITKEANINFNDIPLDDKKTYELFSNGDLDGVFQFESNGMKKFIEELKPTKIDDLISAIALYRPGPMENIPLYIARKNKKEKVSYINDDLKDILKDTYGIIVYQEQIMQIASTMAGFSYSESDELRRAMSKKKEDILVSYKEKFIKGSMNKGYDYKTSNDVYNLILKFANYGFNKAHSVSYAILGYKIAYLKVHFSMYFEKEILNNLIGIPSKTKTSINECKRLGVELLNPSINLSKEKYEIYDNKLLLPLSLIKGIGTLTAKKIVEEREANGKFISYLDFVKRTYKYGKDVLRNLVLAGALSEFNLNKKTLIENLDEAINYAELCSDLDESLVLKPEIKEYEEYEKEELTNMEINLFGFYISNHPTSKYIKDNSITTKKLNNYFDRNINIVLYFERKNEIDTKKKEKMMFITASDIDGEIELVMFPKVYNNYFNIKVPGVYEVNAKVEKRFSKLQLVINSIKKCE